MWITKYRNIPFRHLAPILFATPCVVVGLLQYGDQITEAGRARTNPTTTYEVVGHSESDAYAACGAVSLWALHIEALRRQHGWRDEDTSDMDVPTSFRWHNVNTRLPLYSPTDRLSWFTDPTLGFSLWQQGEVKFEANLTPGGPTCVRVLVDYTTIAANCVAMTGDDFDQWGLCTGFP